MPNFFFRDDWEEVNETLFSQKQGKHIRDQKVTTIARVKNLRNYMEKIVNSKKEKLQHLKDGEELEVCLDLDAGGGRVVAVWFLNENSETLKIHPFLLFEGHDVRNNLEISLGGLTEQIRQIDKANVSIDGKLLKIKIYGLFDLCALNTVIGKQNHSATYFCAWTNCKLDHIRNHKNVEHTESNCKDIIFLTMDDYLKNITHHSIEHLPERKSGKQFGNTIGREEKHGTEEEEGRGNPPPIGRRSGGKSPPGGNSPPFGTTWWGGKPPPGGISLPLIKKEMTYRGGIPYPLKRRSRKLRKLSLYVQNLCFTLISHPTTSVLKR